MPITALPTPPTRDDPENFAQRADQFLAALPAFATEANVTAAEVNGYAATCESAAMVVNVNAWVSGTSYAQGAAVYDTTDFLTYRRRVAGAGTTRPGLDAANWALLTGFGNATLDTAQTFTGVKTFTQTIQGSVSGNAGTAGTASNLSRSVTGAGLATGGGTLTGNQVITVPAATQAQAEAGTDNATAMTPLRTEQHMLANALGWAQTWQDMTGSRTWSTSYQNTTGKPIQVNIQGRSSTSVERYVDVSQDGVSWLSVGIMPNDNVASFVRTGANFVVPTGWYYRVNGALSSLNIWAELR
jgi:hypothetical protein